jgi:hypothetical protein
MRWYRELQHYGFIVQTRAGSLGLDGKGKAPHWRLTELPHEDVVEVLGGTTKRTRFSATKEYLIWDGTVFRDENRIPLVKSPASCRGKHQHRGAGEITSSFSEGAGEITSISGPKPAGEIPSISR